MANWFKNTANSVVTKVKNFGGLSNNMNSVKGNPQNIPQQENNAHNPRNFVVPLQLERLKIDITFWRLCVGEAENAYYPHRYKMQQMFVDKILEGHTLSCMNACKDLTLLKQVKIGKKNAQERWVENKEASKLFEDKKWFKDMRSYILDARFFGYSLIQLGDLVRVGKKYDFKKLTILKRWHVSPDRQQYVQIPYQTWGLNFMDENEKDEHGVPYADWLIYVDTPSDVGSSICGFGLLYNVALYAIILRNNLAHNADYTQMFSAPYRHIKTDTKFDSEEYKNLEAAAAMMGSFGYLLTSTEEEVEFIGGNTGTGFQSYDNLEERCQKMVSKLILGHANALDSIKTALAGGGASKKITDEDSAPEGKALLRTEKKQAEFELSVLNATVYPKLKKLGFPLKDDECFYFVNDKEEFEQRVKNDAANQQTATVAKTMKEAGLEMDPEHFEKITGIPTTKIVEGDLGGNEMEDKLLSPKEKATKKLNTKLKAMYSVHTH